MAVVRRFVLAVIVGLLTFSASGVWALVATEPCTGYEQPGQDDRACPPTCVTCGCCAQAVEPVMLHVAATVTPADADLPVVAPSHPKDEARDILHVPKRLPA